MKRYELIIIGAGPAGLSAAIEAAKAGMQVVVFDENSRPGGQLFKQIHKFFGSKEHRAKERGYKIGQKLLEEAEALGVQVFLEATVMGIFDNKEISVMQGEEIRHYRANALIIATGASENMVPFDGWTLPGVIGAGAAQTMMNLHGIKPGERILMVGSGNVGLVVGYQLLQAGCQVKAVIDAAPKVGGYGVHAAKIARMGVPFYMSHTIKQAKGTKCVEGATLVQVDGKWQPIPGTEKELAVDTICIAVGLSPMSQLARIAGCKLEEHPQKGGAVPVCNQYGETSILGIYAAGDVAGIEEASSAMLQGKIAGTAAACGQGYLEEADFQARYAEYAHSLSQLRQGMFGHGSKTACGPTVTDEGYALSQNLLAKGYLAEYDLERFPGIGKPEKLSPDRPTAERLTAEKPKAEKPTTERPTTEKPTTEKPTTEKLIAERPAAERLTAETGPGAGVRPVIECTQNIPCNPCQDACKKGCIKVGATITNLPVIDSAVQCTGCGMCVVSCSGQAIFLVDADYAPGFAAVSLPYELFPLPEAGSAGLALDRSGTVLGQAEVISVRKTAAMDETAILTMKVPVDWAMKARFFRAGRV